MLSLFPQLIFLTPLAITLVRVTLGIFILLSAWQMSERRAVMSHIRLPIFGRAPMWAITLGGLLWAIVGGLVLIGAWTQAAALIATLGCIKLIIYSRFWPGFTTLPTSTYVLMLVMSLMLTITGAGALALDLPL